MNRKYTKQVAIGNIYIGGNDKILIQSMCNVKTSNYREIIHQINKCAKLGADLMRVSVLDEDDLNAIKKIKQNIDVPLVCDIHFNFKFAIESIYNGADAIRINPGNTSKSKLLDLINVAKAHNTAIRIGINQGSFKSKDNDITNELVDETLKWINYFEENDFSNLVLSIKSSNVLTTISSNKLLSNKTNYPIHIGLTESGFDDIGIIRSVAALSPLLLEGIGSTIRISLTGDPYLEILTAKRLLHDLNLYNDYHTLISCPTCGRCNSSNLKKIAAKVDYFLEKNKINKKVAVMGCEVNGIGEGKNADIGIAGGKNYFFLFKKGKIIDKGSEEEMVKELFEELQKTNDENQ